MATLNMATHRTRESMKIMEEHYDEVLKDVKKSIDKDIEEIKDTNNQKILKSLNKVIDTYKPPKKEAEQKQAKQEDVEKIQLLTQEYRNEIDKLREFVTKGGKLKSVEMDEDGNITGDTHVN